MTQRTTSFALVFALALGSSSGCLIGDELDADANAVIADADVESVDVDTQNMITWNMITWNMITWNMITWNALESVPGAEYPLSAMVMTRFNDWWFRSTRDPATEAVRKAVVEDNGFRKFVEYVASCALEPDQAFSIDGHYFKGGLGLCPAWGELGGRPRQKYVEVTCGGPKIPGPSFPGFPVRSFAPVGSKSTSTSKKKTCKIPRGWSYRDTSDTCQEAVSACVLARFNAFGVPRPLSLRGFKDDGTALELSTEALSPDAHDIRDPEAVFEANEPCSGRNTEPTSDCGWTNHSLGAMDPAKAVTLFAKSAGACDADFAVRVCPGEKPCANWEGRQTTVACRPGGWFYDIHLGRLFSTRPGEDNLPFTVMTRPVDTGVPANVSVGHRDPLGFRATDRRGGVVYPANEGQAFRWREAAWFGNMFESVPRLRKRPYGEFFSYQVRDRDGNWIDKHYLSIDQAIDDVGGSLVIFDTMFVAHSPEWDRDIAEGQLRVCGKPDSPQEGLCAAESVGSAKKVPYWTPWGAVYSGCAREDVAAPVGDGDYDDCKDALFGKPWRNPLTSFLLRSCHLEPSCHYIP